MPLEHARINHIEWLRQVQDGTLDAFCIRSPPSRKVRWSWGQPTQPRAPLRMAASPSPLELLQPPVMEEAPEQSPMMATEQQPFAMDDPAQLPMATEPQPFAAANDLVEAAGLSTSAGAAAAAGDRGGATRGRIRWPTSSMGLLQLMT